MPLFKINAFEAVPHNTAFIVKIDDYNKLSTTLANKDYTKSLRTLNVVKKAEADLNTIQNLFSKSVEHQDFIQKSKLLLAAQSAKVNSLDWLYIFDDYNKQIDLTDILAKNITLNWKTRTLDGVVIFEITFQDRPPLTMTYTQGLLIVSEYPFFVEYSIQQLNNKTTNINKNKDFQSVLRNTGKNGSLALFVNFNYTTNLLSGFLEDDLRKSLDAMQSLMTWTGLDIQFQQENIAINGYVQPHLENQLFEVFSHAQLPEASTITSVLPDNTTFFMYLGAESLKEVYENKHFADNDDFHQYFLPWLGQDIGYAIIEPRGSDFEKEKVALMHIADYNLAMELLDAYAEKMGELEEEQHGAYVIKQILAQDILQPLLGRDFSPIHNPYYTLVGDYVVFANSKKTLENLLNKQVFNQQLGSDINYLQFTASLANNSNLFFYVNTTSILPMLKTFTKEELRDTTQSTFDVLFKLAPLALQMTAHNGKFFTSAKVEHHEEGKQISSVLWRAALKAPAATPPKLMKNHQNGEWEIFIQDVDHRVYLLNKDGEILWEQGLDTTIVSEIHQIDFYENTFLQYFFNTPNRVYLLDRNGKIVEGFPRILPKRATCGMLVVDYFQNRDYRYFVALEDGNIYGYDKYGKLLEGWNPQLNVGHLRHPMQHFLYQGKDYLVALNDEGKLHSYKRNGEKRMESIDFEADFISTFGHDTLQNARIVATDEEGRAYNLNFRGKFFNLKMRIGDNEEVQFEYGDIVGDERKDYVVLGDKNVGVFYYKDDEFVRFFNYKYEEKQDEHFLVKMNKDIKYKIGTLTRAENKIYLLDANGKLYPDFPLAGSTRFIIEDLYQDEKNVLLTANGAEVYAFKLKDLP